MNDVNEVPTYTPPAGVNGPTLGRDLPDGCERLALSYRPDVASPSAWCDKEAPPESLYWWRWPALKVGDRVQLTGTVEHVDGLGAPLVRIDGHGLAVRLRRDVSGLSRVVDQ